MKNIKPLCTALSKDNSDLSDKNINHLNGLLS